MSVSSNASCRPLDWPSPTLRPHVRRPRGPPRRGRPGLFRWICTYVCVCGWVRGLDRLSWPSTSALACRGFIRGGGLRRRLGFSCRCTAWLHVVPGVSAAHLCLYLVRRWHRVRCDVRVVCWLNAFTAACLGIGQGDCRLWLVWRCSPALVG